MDNVFEILGNVLCIGAFAVAIYELINRNNRGKEVLG